MSAIPTMRRGACPSLPEPMQTGDGLLARLQPLAPLNLDQLAGLALLAADRGNGILEVTARGKLQLRGLTPATAPGLAEAVAALGIAVPQGFPVEVSALAGQDPSARFDPRPLARSISDGAAPLVPHLAPKTSVVVDGGGRLRLGGLKADIAVSAGEGGLSLALAGVPLGAVEAERAAAVVIALLQRLAARGMSARMTEVAAAEGIAPLRAEFGLAPPVPVGDAGVDPVGLHPLTDGGVALGLGLEFGQVRAAVLAKLMDAARRAGGTEVEPAAGRALMLIGLAPEAAETLRAMAAGLGFLTDANDPRRRVFACAGRPACASARLDTHALAATLVPLLDGRDLHISGCPKGCAHPAKAALTIVGLDEGAGLVVEGTPRDVPARIVPVAQLRETLQKDLA
ncbi:precorrin-3B synthase [Ancylobacter rudongensis]|uniref:Precorrin-3B synthase n=1 Tax=Ancylobacter rudongensis TaxID=177413 RepID=A0A1G4PEU0_9HYPH|nr:precorrin-3B synthase [Ancylobacter rudongensis]SCW30822.1 precorrin-3B synthase [Ancylobacter rudongensis]